MAVILCNAVCLMINFLDHPTKSQVELLPSLAVQLRLTFQSFPQKPLGQYEPSFA